MIETYGVVEISETGVTASGFVIDGRDGRGGEEIIEWALELMAAALSRPDPAGTC